MAQIAFVLVHCDEYILPNLDFVAALTWWSPTMKYQKPALHSFGSDTKQGACFNGTRDYLSCTIGSAVSASCNAGNAPDGFCMVGNSAKSFCGNGNSVSGGC
jgi:hypothetical protein